MKTRFWVDDEVEVRIEGHPVRRAKVIQVGTFGAEYLVRYVGHDSYGRWIPQEWLFSIDETPTSNP